MATTPYATTDDFGPASQWNSTDEQATDALYSASLVVKHATRRAIYRTDAATGWPLDPRLLEAFREATVALARTYTELGVKPFSGPAGFERKIQSKGLGSANITYQSDPASEDYKRKLAAGGLNHQAAVILADAGLLVQTVQSDSPGDLPWIGGGVIVL